jgi:hypothetical protein
LRDRFAGQITGGLSKPASGPAQSGVSATSRPPLIEVGGDQHLANLEPLTRMLKESGPY